MQQKPLMTQEMLARAFAIIGMAAVIVVAVLLLAQALLFLKAPATHVKVWFTNFKSRLFGTITNSPTSTTTAATTTDTKKNPTTSSGSVGFSYGPGVETNSTTNMGTVTTSTNGTTGVIVGGEPHAASGKADLITRFIALGYLDRNTNQFIPVTGSLDRSQRVGIRFAVINQGGASTLRQWNFNAFLPTSPLFTYNTDMQQPLNPGEKIEYTLGFDRLQDQRSNTLRIELDGGNLIDETDETNNNMQVLIPTQ